MSRSNTDEFIKKATDKHGDACDYSLVVYTKSNIKVKIICKKHGIFETTPNSHLSKKGTQCMKCRGESTSKLQIKDVSHFLKRAMDTHGDRYDYSRVVYKNVSTHVEIVCKEHGEFLQRPDHHYLGSGCSSCQNFGYRPNLQGNFYILKSDNITKVGICNRDVSERIKNINKSSKRDFKLYFSLSFDEGKLPLIVETEILRFLKSQYKSPSEVFDGSTECFYDVDNIQLLKQIQTLGELHD